MAAFILVTAYDKGNRTVRKTTYKLSIPSADVMAVREKTWIDWESYDELRQKALQVGHNFQDASDLATDTATTSKINTIKLRSGEEIPVIHTVEECHISLNE